MKWWFTTGAYCVITIPAFALLVFGFFDVIFKAGIQTMAYLMALKAVWGWLGLLLFLFVWPFSLIFPISMWWAAIKAPSEAQNEARSAGTRSSAGSTVATIILLILFTWGAQWVHGRTIGWIADRNPEASFKAGITGSKPPRQ